MSPLLSQKIQNSNGLIINTTSLYHLGGGNGDFLVSDEEGTPSWISLSQEILYSDLVTLRDNSQLISGNYYRITDYHTTTTQEGTKSADHQFDVIVQAIANNQLDDRAHVAVHSGDTYFAKDYSTKCVNTDLWQIWYCLDNDTNKFLWADTTNGKGVIYRMIDDQGNDIPYDFKNIMFQRYKVTNTTQSSSLSSLYVGTYQGSWLADQGFTLDTDDSIYVYTFTNGCSSITDFFAGTEEASDKSIKFGLLNNYIGPARLQDDTTQRLNNIVFMTPALTSYAKGNNFIQNHIDVNCYNMTLNCYQMGNVFGNECHNITIHYHAYFNIFASFNFDIIIGKDAYYNYIGQQSGDIIAGNGFKYNVIGIMNYENVFGDDFYANTCGASCYKNTFGDNCYANVLESASYSNTFGDSCYLNKFGSGLHGNTIGNKFYGNMLGNNCNSNTFGNNCYYNTIGSRCQSNTFKNYFAYNTLGAYCTNNEVTYDYVLHNIYEENIRYTVLNSETTPTSSSYLCNLHIHSGVKGTSDNTITISVPNLGISYALEVMMSTDGNLKIFNLADLVDWSE